VYERVWDTRAIGGVSSISTSVESSLRTAEQAQTRRTEHGLRLTFRVDAHALPDARDSVRGGDVEYSRPSCEHVPPLDIVVCRPFNVGRVVVVIDPPEDDGTNTNTNTQNGARLTAYGLRLTFRVDAYAHALPDVRDSLRG
jgi:hypothetical protein